MLCYVTHTVSLDYLWWIKVAFELKPGFESAKFMTIWERGPWLNMEMTADIAASNGKFTEFSLHTARAPEIWIDQSEFSRRELKTELSRREIHAGKALKSSKFSRWRRTRYSLKTGFSWKGREWASGDGRDGVGLKRFKVIPRKLKLPMTFFETYPECSLPNTVSK